MYDNEFFVLDLASCISTGEIINSISLALETLNNSGKKIVLKLGNTYLNQSQLLSIQSLITSWGCSLDTVETSNDDTATVVQNMNILVQKPIESHIEPKSENSEKQLEFSDVTMDTNVPTDIKDNISFIDEQVPELKVNEISFDSIQTPDYLDAAQEVLKEAEKPAELSEEKPEEASNEKTEEKPIEEDGLKNSIGVYKKAYDENSIGDNEWEEVDFYESPTNEPVISDSKETMYITQTLRSGQTIEADGNVVIIGDCHPGSEIKAKGDITVWGVLSGIAHAGYSTNNSAKVRALKMNAVQLRIGNCYSRRPDTSNIPYIIRSSVFTPEEARVVDGEIMLFKINQN